MAILTVGFNPAIDRILECRDFHIGGHQQARQVGRLAAGKAANVSRALAQLGTDSIATGFVGSESLEFFHEQLLSAGPGRILCRFVEVGGATRENITILDPARQLETHLRDRGFAVIPEECALLEQKILHELKPGDVVIFAGSLCAGMESGYFQTLLAQCLSRGARIAVDTSGEPLRQAVTSPLWLLKPNLEELSQLAGGQVGDDPQSIVAAAKSLLPRVDQVLVSRGPQGAMLVARDFTCCAIPKVELPVVRTVGCGDHLLAGFISEVLLGRELERALSRAVALATARAMSAPLEDVEEGLVNTIQSRVWVDRVPV